METKREVAEISKEMQERKIRLASARENMIAGRSLQKRILADDRRY